MSTRERDALVQAFVILKALAEHSLSPTQTSMARRGAGNCLWGLGIEGYEDIVAVKPEGLIIDALPAPGAIPGGTTICEHGIYNSGRCPYCHAVHPELGSEAP